MKFAPLLARAAPYPHRTRMRIDPPSVRSLAAALLAMLLSGCGAVAAQHHPEVFGFAAEVDADQRMEIERMRTLQAAPHGGHTRADGPAGLAAPSAHPNRSQDEA